MKKSLVIGLLLAAIIGVASYVAAGPYLAIHGIRTALAEQDSGRLQKHVDFPALRVNLRAQVEDALAALLDTPGPALLHVAIDARANVWPLVPPNNANSTMLDSNPAHAKAAQENTNAIPA